MRTLIDTGWDSRAWVVDGVWLEREPRRPEVADRLSAEVRLMEWLAPRLPLPVPEPELVRDEPLRVRHRLVVGEAFADGTAAMAEALGAFLRTLHDVPLDDAVGRGAMAAAVARGELLETIDRMRVDVLPLLYGVEARVGAGLLEDCAAPPPSSALVHGDLGPAHVLVADDAIAGVIDWTDARIGDPAIDLAWVLHGTPAPFADRIAAAYGADDALRRRALSWHRLGPWHEVLYGLDTGVDAYAASGLAGVRKRLPLG